MLDQSSKLNGAKLAIINLDDSGKQMVAECSPVSSIGIYKDFKGKGTSMVATKEKNNQATIVKLIKGKSIFFFTFFIFIYLFIYLFVHIIINNYYFLLIFIDFMYFVNKQS